MSPIPGDGNCPLSSISYCLTGNMDNFHKIRAIIVDNMIGNLKEACNKFIANKFTMSAINFRNVNDYIVKPKMRNNSTWGTDVELIALALLLRTNIWIYSTEFGNKWMLFSGRGASLIDALTQPVVNTGGSIYLNHNGLHYEPVLVQVKSNYYRRSHTSQFIHAITNYLPLFTANEYRNLEPNTTVFGSRISIIAHPTRFCRTQL